MRGVSTIPLKREMVKEDGGERGGERERERKKHTMKSEGITTPGARSDSVVSEPPLW